MYGLSQPQYITDFKALSHIAFLVVNGQSLFCVRKAEKISLDVNISVGVVPQNLFSL